MDNEETAGQTYARVLYSLNRGYALWFPEPKDDLPPAYRETGVQIGDVGVVTADGRFDFVFNACCSADDPINQAKGVPNGFQPIVWNGLKQEVHKYCRPGQLVLSQGAKTRALGNEGTTSFSGIPGASFSVTFAQNKGAVIFLPNGANAIDCREIAKFREYAGKYSVSWYEFMNQQLGMQVENGGIHFITGFDKTDCWDIAVTSTRERTCEITVNTDGLAGGDGLLKVSDSSQNQKSYSRSCPPGNPHFNQALFIRGLRISLRTKFRSLFSGPGAEVTSMYESSWKGALGKKGTYIL